MIKFLFILLVNYKYTIFRDNSQDMQRFSQLSYETGRIQISTTIFESMVHNLGEKIRKMNIKIQFVNQKQKQSFLLSEQRYKEREQGISLQSEEQIENPNEEELLPAIIIKDPKKLRQIGETRTINVGFEMSILLQQKYMKKLQKIGKRLSVWFRVVPNKVKISGLRSQLLDQAYVQFGKQFQDKIHFVPVPEYGREIFQSKYYKNVLKQHKVQILKMLNKYYFWFELGKQNPTQSWTNIINNTKHKLMPLGSSIFFEKSPIYRNKDYDDQMTKIVHGQFLALSIKNSIIAELTSILKATIFQKYIQKELNRVEKRPQRKVELSEDRKYLILHLDAQQQITIQEQSIKQQFRPFTFTFLYFSKDIDINALTDFIKSYTHKSSGFSKNKKKHEKQRPFFIEIMQNFVAIAISQVQLQGSDNKDLSRTQINFDEHDLIIFLRQIPEQFMNFKLAVQSLLAMPEDDSDFKKFSFEKDYIEKVTYISCKNQRAKNYQIMFQFYLQNKFNQQFKQKKEELDRAKSNLSVSGVQIDMSGPVNESSIMLDHSLNISFPLVQNNPDITIQQFLPPELSSNNQNVFRFQSYTFLLKEQSRQKKFSSKTDNVGITQQKLRSKEIEKAISEATGQIYKIFKVIIAQKFKEINLQEQLRKILQVHPELQRYNRWVTVFYGGKQANYDHLYSADHQLKVLRVISENVKIMKEGFLMRTNVVFMYTQFNEKGTVQLGVRMYEPFCYIKRVQKN